MRHIATALAIILTLLVGAFFVFVFTPDIPVEMVDEKYSNETSQFIVLDDGSRVHVRDQGNKNGPALVLVHGSNASLHTWEPWVSLLADDFRIVTLDLPGHGLTGRVPGDDYTIANMVETVAAVTSELGIAKFHLAGNSMGGNVSWRFAIKYPERVDRLILVDASGYPRKGDASGIFKLIQTPVFGHMIKVVGDADIIRQNLHSAMAVHDVITDEMVQRYHELALREGSRTATHIRLNRPRSNEQYIEKIKSLPHKTLILWGQKDTWTPLEWAHRFDEDIPDSTLKIYLGVGHIPMEEVAEASAEDVRVFLLRQ